MNNTQLWLRGMAAVAIGGLSGTLTAYFVSPQSFSLDKAGLVSLIKAVVVGAVVPTLAYLKQSPLPAASVTVTQEATVTATKN